MPSSTDASVARRYARALLSLAVEDGSHERIGEQLGQVVKAIQASPEARALAADPSAPAKQRQELVGALASSLSLSPQLVNFLRLLVDRARLSDVAAVARAYGALLDTQVGRVRAAVVAPEPLSEDETGRLRDALAKATHKTVVLESRVDASLLGGVVAQVGPLQYDGSLRTQLERLREELKRAPVRT